MSLDFPRFAATKAHVFAAKYQEKIFVLIFGKEGYNGREGKETQKNIAYVAKLLPRLCTPKRYHQNWV